MPQCCGTIMYVFIYCACLGYVVNCHTGLLKLGSLFAVFVL